MKVICNICGFEGDTFQNDGWHVSTQCPRCDMGVRNRLVVAALKLVDEFHFNKLITGNRVLHFAPENYVKQWLASLASFYRTADISPGHDYQVDMSDMPTIPDNSFDCIIACDVLEHIIDDRAAMREAHRVLSPGGYCIYTVPQRDNLEITYEDPSITTPEGRKEAFGQNDHLRIYGFDFIPRLQECGFEVAAVDETWFQPDDVVRYVLSPPVYSEKRNVTNFRKVFFGRKV